ncbi:MAG: methyltransferase domain-containing protein [Nitrospina sp.]|nr:methyltransferase domain-containing protein [Nitrospina sp.]
MNDRSNVSQAAQTGVSRNEVRDFYAKAAVASQESLCCPVKYDPGDLSHVPEEVLSISYGCGSPVSRASISPGETLVDLGSGGGIDCFIAAKVVGPEGRVIGVDMTDEMLEKARRHATQVADNLGYANVDFRQGFLEAIPVDDASVNAVTSNCVVNLSPAKQEVFREISRILKPGGRFVIADIISDREVPDAMRQNTELWGECVSGALTLERFLEYAKGAGFHGFQVSKDYLWKVVEGIKFYSYIITAYKPDPLEDPSCCKEYFAVYGGPFDRIEVAGQEFNVGVAREIDDETCHLLSQAPYSGLFSLIDPDNENAEPETDSCCG